MAVASDQARLRRQALGFRFMSTGAIGVALVCVGAQIVVAAAPLWRGGDARQAWMNVGLQAVLAAPALFYVAGLRRARQVFRRVGAGEMLTAENSLGLKGVGLFVLAGAMWSLCISDGLAPDPSSLVPVWLGQIGTAARDLTLAALGLGLMMIGRVWAAAARLKAENDSFL